MGVVGEFPGISQVRIVGKGCHDAAIGFGVPFISGKDSLNNEFHAGDRHMVIPPTLLISAMGIVPDVRRCVTMDLKEPGSELYLVGATADELGGSDTRERERYRGQLEGYAAIMRVLDGRPIRLGLYFPLLGGWREWPASTRS